MENISGVLRHSWGEGGCAFLLLFPPATQSAEPRPILPQGPALGLGGGHVPLGALQISAA